MENVTLFNTGFQSHSSVCHSTRCSVKTSNLKVIYLLPCKTYSFFCIKTEKTASMQFTHQKKTEKFCRPIQMTTDFT